MMRSLQYRGFGFSHRSLTGIREMWNQLEKVRVSSSLLRRLRHQMGASTVPNRRSFTTSEGHRPIIFNKRSVDILHDPWFNKGTAFSTTARDRLDLQGLLPPNITTSEQQIGRLMADLKRLEVHARDGPTDPNALTK